MLYRWMFCGVVLYGGVLCCGVFYGVVLCGVVLCLVMTMELPGGKRRAGKRHQQQDRSKNLRHATNLAYMRLDQRRPNRPESRQKRDGIGYLSLPLKRPEA
jgi:hypothetical protein